MPSLKGSAARADTPGMPSPAQSSMVLSAMTLLATVAASFAVARAAGRRARLGARARERALTSSFQGYLEWRTDGRDLRQASNAADESAFWTALETYAARLSRSEWKRLAGALDPCVHERRERRALRDDSPWRRELAARRLGLLGSSASRRALRVALERGPEPVTMTAATALARVRDVKALRWILAHPERLASRSRHAWTGLLRGFGRNALPMLAQELARGTHDPRLERALIESLGLGRFDAAVPAIAARLERADLELRVAAVRALGLLDAAEQVHALVKCLEDPAWQVRAQAARALGRLRSVASLSSLEGLLTDRSWWVRRHAAYALRELGPDGHAALRRVIEKSPDPYARDIADEALQGGLKASA
jgi:HEAT repeats